MFGTNIEEYQDGTTRVQNVYISEETLPQRSEDCRQLTRRLSYSNNYYSILCDRTPFQLFLLIYSFTLYTSIRILRDPLWDSRRQSRLVPNEVFLTERFQ
jgi:hypothetical protein